ncbi:MAG: glycosyltransferase [Planctomycetaceae bacterium]
MNILFLSTRQSKPSFRFRVEPMLPFFAARGHRCDVAFLADGAWKRLRLYRRLSRYEAVFVQKRLFSRWELSLIRRAARRLIYDLDDAVMFHADGGRDRRRQRRFHAMAAAADLVICGNQYLADLARRAGGRTVTIPTCIDTERFCSLQSPRAAARGVTIGWTGSRSTNRYLNELFPVLAAFGRRVELVVMSDAETQLDWPALGDVPWRFVRWSPEVETTVTASFDLGLMPLPDDPWTRGKCGFKALQYMALGRVAVAAAVGVNREIITHGEDGFLCETPGEWRAVIERLLADAELRRRIGLAARNRIETAYSLKVHGPRTVEAVEAASRVSASRTG